MRNLRMRLTSLWPVAFCRELCFTRLFGGGFRLMGKGFVGAFFEPKNWLFVLLLGLHVGLLFLLRFLLLGVFVFQLGHLFFRGHRHAMVTQVAGGLNRYCYDILQFLTLCTDEVPLPTRVYFNDVSRFH